MSISSVVRKVFGSRNDRLLSQLNKTVNKINNLEEKFSKFTDEELKNKTQEFKDGHDPKWDHNTSSDYLNKILPEAFAIVREVSKRQLAMRHFDVQLIGGMVIHSGKVAEMSTGEGKTLSATLPVYLNAITDKGVHVVTVNDYLAKRDAEWMSPLYTALGLTVGVVTNGISKEERKEAYNADITYGTNNEFGFDYLRDNMAFNKDEKVQRDLNFAIIDEVDSILIDEARTPLIISGANQDSTEMYKKINKIIPSLQKQEEKDGSGDFSIDEKSKQAFLTEDGHEKIEEILVKQKLLEPDSSLYDANNIMLIHHIYASIRAYHLFNKDVDYIVKDGQVVIVDEFTGRTMPGRRWSDGLHQAVEAKENVKIQNENQTLASITFQNYFRLYNKLSGMTGTADTEAYELHQIYGLEVAVIPTNKPNKRIDHSDVIYLTQEEKYQAIIEDIKDCVDRGQPTLVGTASIESSELVSKLLKQAKVKHQVLNAKFHDKEAEIIAEAGRPGVVTIATNMAGRGTDIVLGGKKPELEEDNKENKNNKNYEIELKDWEERHKKVLSVGGLHVIGTERHESRRIDNQLRGRSARQGDPGSTRFYLSVKDNLMRIFVSDKIAALLNKLGDTGGAITHPWVTRAIENAQRKVEGYNFDIRKQLLQFDDVANDQRKVIYTLRNDLINAENISDLIKKTRIEVFENIISDFIPLNSIESEWDIPGLIQTLEHSFGQKVPVDDWLKQDDKLYEDSLKVKIIELLNKAIQDKEQEVGAENMRYLEKNLMLNILDNHWKEHLSTMDYMRQSIHLRGYAQKDPKQEYKREAFTLFTDMLDSIDREVISILSLVKIKHGEESPDKFLPERKSPSKLEYKHSKAQDLTHPEEGDLKGDRFPQPTVVRTGPKIGRNQSCPCGSGKKYKQCHGREL